MVGHSVVDVVRATYLLATIICLAHAADLLVARVGDISAAVATYRPILNDAPAAYLTLATVHGRGPVSATTAVGGVSEALCSATPAALAFPFPHQPAAAQVRRPVVGDLSTALGAVRFNVDGRSATHLLGRVVRLVSAL